MISPLPFIIRKEIKTISYSKLSRLCAAASAQVFMILLSEIHISNISIDKNRHIASVSAYMQKKYTDKCNGGIVLCNSESESHSVMFTL